MDHLIRAAMGSSGQLTPAELKAHGAPYPSQAAGIGGVPTVSVDIAVCAVLIPCYLSFAAFNMTVFQLNNRRGHKFLMSGVCFGFCMARTTALVMRIVWACFPHDVNIAIAANVFTNAGVILLFVVNTIFAQRLIRAYHPKHGWGKGFRAAFIWIYFSFFAILALVITSIVWTSFTLDLGLINRLTIIRKFASTYLAFLAFLPAVIGTVTPLVPRSAPIEKFGEGRLRTKVRLLIFTSLLLALGAGFRCGVGYVKRPLNDPGWFNSKPAYYCFNFAIELIVLGCFAFWRIDKRFHVPDGSNAPGDYLKGRQGEKHISVEDGLNSEEEPSNHFTTRPSTALQQEREQTWESRLEQELQSREA